MFLICLWVFDIYIFSIFELSSFDEKPIRFDDKMTRNRTRNAKTKRRNNSNNSSIAILIMNKHTTAYKLLKKSSFASALFFKTSKQKKLQKKRKYSSHSLYIFTVVYHQHAPFSHYHALSFLSVLFPEISSWDFRLSVETSLSLLRPPSLSWDLLLSSYLFLSLFLSVFVSLYTSTTYPFSFYHANIRAFD